MDFDGTVAKKTPSGSEINYGIVFGGNKIVFIKSGLGGSERGYEDKYVKMARMLNSSYGCTVIAASNPQGVIDSTDTDAELIRLVAQARGLSEYTVTLFGVSDGGAKVITMADSIPGVKKLICVNMPLMLNFQRKLKQLKAIPEIEKVFVYGTRDPSYTYLVFLDNEALPNLSVVEIEGADHQFKGMLDEFTELAELAK